VPIIKLLGYLKGTFSKIQKETGIRKGFHTFRHTHATELIAKGIPIHDVSRRLGHSNISTTLNIYTHFLPAADDTLRGALEEIEKGRI
jgi:integrase